MVAYPVLGKPFRVQYIMSTLCLVSCLILSHVGDLLGRAIALHVPAEPQKLPQKHDFAFDKVFSPAACQVMLS